MIQELAVTIATLTFGDVSGNGDGRAPNLRSQPEHFVTRPRSRACIDSVSQLDRLLPGIKVLITRAAQRFRSKFDTN
jgi:hypothetical protein